MIKLAIVFLAVWIIIAICFYKAGLMALEEDVAKCKKCKWKISCAESKNRICVRGNEDAE